MTLSLFLASLFLDLSLVTKFIAGRILDFAFSGKIRNFLKLVISFTFFTEATGAFALYFHFKKVFPFEKAVFYSIFHSVSSFCNCGLSLYDSSLIKIAKESNNAKDEI